MAWAILAIGLFGGWVGSALSILAVAADPERDGWLIHGTAQFGAALTALLILARAWASDARAGFTSALDAAGPGVGGRALGRWLGSTLTGAICGGAILVVLMALDTAAQPPPLLYLLSTIICFTALVSAWSLLANALIGGPGALLLSLFVWGAGLLPWGAPGGPGGAAATWVGRLLPSPTRGGTPLSVLAVALATAGVLVVALSRLRPATPRP